MNFNVFYNIEHHRHSYSIQGSHYEGRTLTKGEVTWAKKPKKWNRNLFFSLTRRIVHPYMEIMEDYIVL